MRAAAYHRLTHPIHGEAHYKSFANTFLVIGLVPLSVSIVLASFLVTSVAIGRGPAYGFAGALALVVAFLWWFLPLRRVHDRFDRPNRRDRKKLVPDA